MATEIRFVEDEIGRRLEEISSDPATKILKYPGYLISNKPIQSERYADCNGVAVLNHNFGGLSHYDLMSENPSVYLPRMIEEILSISDTTNLSAVLVGGDKGHFNSNKEILKKYKIPIFGEYCDEWEECETLPLFPNEKRMKANKHILVIPQTHEVLMYSLPVGYKKLTP